MLLLLFFVFVVFFFFFFFFLLYYKRPIYRECTILNVLGPVVFLFSSCILKSNRLCSLQRFITSFLETQPN